METIGSIYSDFIKERFIKDSLKNGEIPSVEDVELSVRDIRIANNNFNSPMTRIEKHYISNGEVSSANKMNLIFKDLNSDLKVAIKSILKQGNEITDIYNSNISRLEGLEKKVRQSQSKIEKMLFASKNTDRHENIFYEKFESLDMVNQELTTASVDTTNNSVSLKETSNNIIKPGSIQSVGSINPSVQTSSDLPGLEASNVLTSSSKVWQHQVKCSESVDKVSVDLVFEMNNSPEINQLLINPFSPNSKTQLSLEISFSQDRINWSFPDGETEKRILKETSFNFSSVKARYWRFRFTKFGSDGLFGGSYVYNFGLKSVLFLGKSYDKVNRLDISKFVSKIIKPENLGKINQLTFQACQTKPIGTEIKYEISPLVQSQIESIEQGISSIDDYKYYLVDLSDKESFYMDMLKLSFEDGSDNILVNENISYKTQRTGDYSLDYLVSDSESKSDITILRNQGDNSLNSQIGVSHKINGLEEGWLFDGKNYSTYVMVETEDGEEIDLGASSMVINGQTKTGKIKLSNGLNHISTKSENWFSMDIGTLPQGIGSADPLYPYNHKYLIEGIQGTLYGRDLSYVMTNLDDVSLNNAIDPYMVYQTKRRNWAIKMAEVSFDKFESFSNTTLDVFSFKLDNNGEERIIVKSTSENGLLNSERFSIITKIQEANPVKGLILKATLTTEDVTKTPVLTEYLFKFR